MIQSRLELRLRGACVTFIASIALLWPIGAEGQIPSIPRGSPIPQNHWWFTGGGTATRLNDIYDRTTEARWAFGGDPLWMMRGAIERALPDGSALGVAVGYGNVDVIVSPLVFPSDPPTPSCVTICSSRVDLYSVMATFRSGGNRPGFDSSIEASAGALGMLNLESKQGEPIRNFTSKWHPTAALGFGFGYGFSTDFHVALVQDVGIGFRGRSNTPEGRNTTFRISNTRLGLRYGF